jgi:copper chaperone CopZ
MKKVKLKIEGMTCGNCEGHVKSELDDIGAKDVSVSFSNGEASMNVEDSVTGDQLFGAVEEAGYKVTKVEFE